MTDAPIPANDPGLPVIHENLFEHVKDFVAENLQPQIVSFADPATGDVGSFIITRDGVDALDPALFDGYRANPRFRRGTATLLDLTSFIAHANRFKDPDSAIFANNSRTAPSVTSVLDYHESVETRVAEAATADGGVDLSKARYPHPRFGKHRGFHAFPLSDEWKAWTENNAKVMSMADFASFLEDRIIDVVPPNALDLGGDTQRFVDTQGGLSRIADPATLVELSRNFHVNEAAVVKQAVNLSSGEGQIQLASEHVGADGQAVTIPRMFVVLIPVFRGEKAYPVIARLRYRATAGAAPRFWYELWRSDLAFDAAFDGALNRVRAETGLPVLLGSPE